MSKLIIAAAGSGKTETLVNMALHEQRPVLITTYTDNNVEEIKSRFYQKNGCIPQNITILPWYTFMLSHGVKPYQDLKHKDDIRGVCLTGGISTKYISKDSNEYYFSSDGSIYADKIAQFLIWLLTNFLFLLPFEVIKTPCLGSPTHVTSMPASTKAFINS